MYQIALCDDEDTCLHQLEKVVKAYCSTQRQDVKIHLFEDSDCLASLIERGKIFDAYILDIEMQKHSGLDLARMINEQSDLACIILLTAHASYAVEACGMKLFRYILKTQLNHELPRTLEDLFTCMEQLHGEELYLLSNQRRFLKIPQKKIAYIYKKQKNSVLVLSDGKEHPERLSLQEVYKKLDNKNMVFLDRGIILNLWHVQSVSGRTVRMDNGFEVSTSPAHIEDLKKSLTVFWGKII